MNEYGAEILLVEDNPEDARLTLEAFKTCRRPHRFQIVTNGLEALAFLRRQGTYAQSPRPHLILLDLNLPEMDGRRFLAEIKADDTLKKIPVVVLTTSQAEEDVLEAYNLCANCYVAKPLELNAFLEAVQGIETFWLVTASLPQQ
jgi:two-component system, chemotaxis family, response regulator Rcp1